MLENKVIIYDDSCPMCKLYTSWFVAWGFLKRENRIGFATAPPEITDRLDLDRARHEIPLFDRKTGQTIYGLPALTHLLESRWSVFKPLFASKPFWWFFYPLYQIITYNRRVIAGCKHCCGFDCAPDLNRLYRSVYLMIVAAAVGFGMAILAGTLANVLLASFAIVGLMVGATIRITGESLAAWNFAGNFATVMLIVCLTLTPIILLREATSSVQSLTLTTAGLLGIWEINRRF